MILFLFQCADSDPSMIPSYGHCRELLSLCRKASEATRAARKARAQMEDLKKRRGKMREDGSRARKDIDVIRRENEEMLCLLNEQH